MSDLWIALFELSLGLFFAVHCSISRYKELQSGQALGGRYGNYDRETSPTGFWLIMTGNIGAAILGIAFMLIGLAGMLVYFEVMK